MAQLDTGEFNISDLLPFGRRRKEYPEPSTPGMLGGFDPQQIQAMMAQFGATEKERSDANKQALFALGFGLLGGRKGSELQTIGRAGLGAMDYRNRTLAAIPEQRAQQYTAAAQLMKMRQAEQQAQARQAMSGQIADIFSGKPNLPAMGPGGPTPANAAAASPMSQIQQLEAVAKLHLAQGDTEGAKRLFDAARAQEEKFSPTPQTYRDPGGQIRQRLISERGGTRDLSGSPAEKLHFADTGGMAGVGLDPYTGAPASAGLPMTPTFGERTGQGQLALAQQKFAYDQAQAAAGGGVGKEAFANANVLRDEYTKQSAPFIAVRDAYRRIQSAAESAKTDKGGAPDIAMVTSYMKVLDPGSTVNQGEYANVVNAAGVPEQVRALYNSLVSGGKLAPGMRDSIVKTAHGLYKKADEAHGNTEKRYRGLAERLKVDPENVIVDFRLEGTEPVLSAPAGASPVDRAQAIVDSWKKRKQ